MNEACCNLFTAVGVGVCVWVGFGVAVGSASMVGSGAVVVCSAIVGAGVSAGPSVLLQAVSPSNKVQPPITKNLLNFIMHPLNNFIEIA